MNNIRVCALHHLREVRYLNFINKKNLLGGITLVKFPWIYPYWLNSLSSHHYNTRFGRSLHNNNTIVYLNSFGIFYLCDVFTIVPHVHIVLVCLGFVVFTVLNVFISNVRVLLWRKCVRIIHKILHKINHQKKYKFARNHWWFEKHLLRSE